MRNRSARRGFTLVEVLVATAVVAIGLLAALTAFSMANRVKTVSSNDTAIAFLAQQKLAEVRTLGREGLAQGTEEGDFGPDFPQYQWAVTVHEPNSENVVRADLVIRNREAGRERETQFSTAVF